MEDDFDGFVNYVFELKKDRDNGDTNAITDMDLLSWKKSLYEKEKERKTILDNALDNIEQRKRFMMNDHVVSTKQTDKLYEISMNEP